MPFDLRNDANRVRTALYLPAEDFDEVLLALITAQQKSVFIADDVLKDLARLEKLGDIINTELSSPNSALTRADVLSFAEGQRAKGMMIQQYTLVKKIGAALGLTPNLDTIEDIAFAMGFSLGSRSAMFGQIQRS